MHVPADHTDPAAAPSGGPDVSPGRRRGSRFWWWLPPALLLGLFGAVGLHAGAQASGVASDAARSLDTALRGQGAGLVKSHAFRRSLTGGTDDLVLRLTGGLSLHLRSEVKTGVFGRGGAVVDTTLSADPGGADRGDMTGEQWQIVRRLASGGARMHTVVNPDGRTVSRLVLPGGTLRAAGPGGDSTVTWQALTGEITRADPAAPVQADLDWNGLEVGGPAGRAFKVSGVSYHGRLLPGSGPLSPGVSTLRAGALTFPAAHLDLGGVTASTRVVSQGDALALSLALAADRVGAPGSGATRDVRWSLEMSHVNADAAGRMSTVLGQPEHAKFLRASADLETAATRPYVFSQDPELHRLLEDLTVPIQQVLAGHPVLSVAVSEVTPSGKVSATARVEIPDPSQVDVAGLVAGQFTDESLSSGTPQVVSLVHSLTASGDLASPAQEAVDRLGQFSPLAHLIDAPVHGRTPPYVPVSEDTLIGDLRDLIARHQLTFVDDVLRTHVVFSGGRLYLNGVLHSER